MSAWILQSALGAGLLALLILALERWVPRARSRPALLHALWVLVLVKLLLPPLVQLPLSVPAPAFMTAVPAIVDAPAGLAPEPSSATPTNGSEPDGVNPGSREARAPRTLSWSALVTALWLAGALTHARVHARGLLALRATTLRGAPAPEGLAREVRELSARLGLRPPRLLVVAGDSAPMVWGLLRPQLLWPSVLLGRWEAEGTRAVLAHELAHLRRRDHWVGWLELLAACAWWWNPLVHLARRRLRACAELCCDARALELVPGAQRAFAAALIDVAAQPRAARIAPALAVVERPDRTLERRLTVLLTHASRPSNSPRTLALVAAAALAALPCCNLRLDPGSGLVHAELQSAGDEPPWRAELSDARDLPAEIERVEVWTGWGGVRVVPSPDEQLRVRARVSAGEEADPARRTEVFGDHVQIASSDGILSIRSSHVEPVGWKAWVVDLEVALPRALPVHAESRAGKVAVHVGSGRVLARTGAGGVVVGLGSRALEYLEVSSGAGSIDARAASLLQGGDLRTGAGTVRLTLELAGAAGDVALESGAGPLTLELPRHSPGSFELRTYAGSLGFFAEELTLTREGDVRVGRVQVGEGGPRYLLSTGAGEVRVDS